MAEPRSSPVVNYRVFVLTIVLPIRSRIGLPIRLIISFDYESRKNPKKIVKRIGKTIGKRIGKTIGKRIGKTIGKTIGETIVNTPNSIVEPIVNTKTR